VPLQHDEVQPVGERELGHPALQPRPCIASICRVMAQCSVQRKALACLHLAHIARQQSQQRVPDRRRAPEGVCARAAGAAVTGDAETAAAVAALPTSRSLLDNCGLASQSCWLPPEAAEVTQRCRLCRDEACDCNMTPRASGAALRRHLGAHVHGFAGRYASISQ
jgi:hypothetical protein